METTSTYTNNTARNIKCQERRECPRISVFRNITHESMRSIWPVLRNEPGRTTDFSYGGLLMWVKYFNYKYAFAADTLFIKGVVESDLSKPAFSLPIGKLPLANSIAILKDYCARSGESLELSAVPEYALPELKRLGAKNIEELEEWGDYLYDAISLATLSGKKYGKKRNHVNQFENRYPNWHFESLTQENASLAERFMDVLDREGDTTDSAVAERILTREMLSMIKTGDNVLKGGILFAGDEMAGFTIGDIKGDTLFVHIEKATRKITGSYEMINKVFASEITKAFPFVSYINREDDAGDEGLRKAKESYHPLEKLKKYNVIF